MKTKFVQRAGAALLTFAALAALATPAFAHDNLGGDETSMALAMFMFATAIAATGAFCIWWAWRTGQFRNIEEAKYAMLENAPDLDLLPGNEKTENRNQK